MNAKILLFLICTVITATVTRLFAQDVPFEQQLPSQQTEQVLEQLPPSEGLKPGTRARPTDVNGNDRPQKLPLGSVGIVEASLLALLGIIYFLYSKRKMIQRKSNKLILIMGFLALGVYTHAADPIKAVPDNYYIKPGSGVLLDVTINDSPGACASDLENLKVEIITASDPAGSPVTWSLFGNKIRVVSRPTAFGQRELQYKIICKSFQGLESDIGTVYLNFAERPDFVDDAACTIERPAFTWDIERKALSTEKVQSYAFMLVGNVDTRDDELEIITTDLGMHPTSGLTLPHYSDNILIFDPNLNLKAKIPVPKMDTYIVQAIAIGDIDPANDDGPEIVMMTGGYGSDPSLFYRLICYHLDQATGNWYQKWISSEQCFTFNRTNIPIGSSNIGSTISIADVDGDGLIEILAGDRIFSGGDADGNNGGQLLATLPDIPTIGRGRHQFGTYVGYMHCLADIDGDGKMEVVAGNATYKLDLNRDNPALSTATLYRTVNQSDGYTSVADIDGDGILDVVVVARNVAPIRMYAWQGSANNAIIGDVISNGGAGSRAFIGDINGDGRADIAFTRYLAFDAYSYNPVSNKFDLLFTVPTSDASGATTMTMFDFDNDGKVELVYRDETDLRIIDSNGDNIMTIPCFSGTHTEYPVVADVDRDGHADIIVSGGTYYAAPAIDDVNRRVYLQRFGSITPDTWSPARGVWHQHGYNPTMINEDLTIPRYPLSPATKVVHEDGSIHYPFNSFLQQSSHLNSQGEPLNKAPDLAFQARNQKLEYNEITDKMTVTAYITNAGSKEFKGNINLLLYGYTEIPSHTYTLVKSQVYTNQNLEIFDELVLTLEIPNYSTLPTNTFDNWVLAMNMNDDAPNAPKPYFEDQKECISWNNMTSRISYIAGQVVLCEGDQAMLNIDPAGVYDCYWFTLDGSGNKVPFPSVGNNKGDSKLVTKQTSQEREFYLIDLFKKNTLQPITTVPDTVFIYQSMDTLVWNGKADGDWHNVQNWDCPTDPTQAQRFRYVPGSCTNVLIPIENQDGNIVTQYPDLSTTSTDYKSYLDPKCNNVTFEHAGEIALVDRLKYKKAFIHLDVVSNRWYTFAPPLRSFYTGDIYKSDPNPFNDNVFVFTRLYSQADPEYNSYIEGNWGRAFSTPTQTFSAGQGLGLWVDDKDEDETNRSDQHFVFPKGDAFYNEYNYDGSFQSGPHNVGDRTQSHKFIFEETIDASKNVKLKVEAPTAGKDILVANPYMAHLDFDKFYQKNQALIQPYYKVMEDNYSYATYFVSGGSTGNPVMTQNIAPMQAILVTPKVPINAANPLVTTGDMTLQKAGAKIRNAKEANQFIRISISDIKMRSRASLIVDKSADKNNSFNTKTDVMKTIKEGVMPYPSIYFLTADKKYADIKSIASLTEMVFPIGIACDATGPMAIGFENLSLFSSDYYIYLIDKYENKEILLNKTEPVYCFNKTTNTRFTDDRFELRFSTELLSIDNNQPTDGNIKYTTAGRTLLIYTEDNVLLKDVIIYDLQGRLVTNNKVNNETFSISLPKGVYVVRATSDSNSQVFKVIIQ